MAIFSSVWLQIFPFGYTILYNFHREMKLAPLFSNLAPELATTFKIPEGALPVRQEPLNHFAQF